jgi:hypothetical protein
MRTACAPATADQTHPRREPNRNERTANVDVGRRAGRVGRRRSWVCPSKAADEIIAALGRQLGVALSPNTDPIQLENRARIRVDAATADGKIVVEAYARQGKLKDAAQPTTASRSGRRST